MYKFRFVTSSLLARYKRVSSPVVINNALKILLEQNYIGRHYNNTYRLKGKGASYYLTPKTLRLLRDEHSANSQVVHAMYKNKSVSDGFISHNLDVLSSYLNLRSAYSNTFHIFTKYELGDYGYFPEQRPDLYLNRIGASEDTANEYLLDIFTDTQLFVIKKRVKAYMEHFESGDWESEAETEYPVILIACPDSRTEEKLQKHIENTLDGAGIDDLKVYTTTSKSLLAAESPNLEIWSNIYEPKDLIAL